MKDSMKNRSSDGKVFIELYFILNPIKDQNFITNEVNKFNISIDWRSIQSNCWSYSK